ncbi:MAG: N utilization substance protein B [Actinobacteria bacterium]|nr:N utilization substance protein B [Actinomycetota bacterium]
MDATPKRITKPDGTVLELVETIPADAHGRRPSRTKARKQALDLLYAAELRGLTPAQVLAESEEELRPFAADLVAAVEEHAEQIDALLAKALAADWSLERMPRIDRCLARLAVGELLSGTVAAEVAVEQAAALATELSTDDSAAFLNGLLAAVRRGL